MTPAHQAFLIFLTSATAVQLGTVRVSDIALLGFVISLIFCKSPPIQQRIGSITILFLMITAVVFSTLNQVWSSNVYVIGESLRNAVSIPIGLVIAIACLIKISKKRALQIISSYTSITLLTSSLIFFIHEVSPISWILVADETSRFSGLSLNPNQLALYLLPVPFFSVLAYLENMKTGRRMKIELAAAFCLNLAIIGKGLFIAWFVSLGFLVFIGWKLSGKRPLTYKLFAERLSLMVLIIILAIPLLFLLYIGELPGSQADQGQIRLSLWKNGLDAWLQAPLLGNGPGHYSGLTASFEGMEAHNTFIDWLSAYGLIGLFPLLIFFGYSFVSLFRRDAWILIALNIALLSQITFHFYGRQPVFWLWWIMGLILYSGISAPLRKPSC